MKAVLGEIAKALTAFVVAGYSLYTVATTTGTPGGSGVTSGEWVRVAVEAAVAGLAVWLVPNATSSGGAAGVGVLGEIDGPAADEVKIPPVEVG